MRADRAYKCSRCGRWIPREGHADWCSRVKPAANHNTPQPTGLLHIKPTAVHSTFHRENPGSPRGIFGLPLPPHRVRPSESNHMGTNHEVIVRLSAARTWLDHALAGECAPEDAVEAVERLCGAVKAYVEGRA